MIRNGKEADIFGGGADLSGYLVDAMLKVLERDLLG